MNSTICIRRAEIKDIPDIVRLRRIMFESMGFNDPELLTKADKAMIEYLKVALPANQYCGWVAMTPDGLIVSNGGVIIDQHPPGYNNLSGKLGYIANIATVAEYRRQGIANQIMQTILQYLKDSGIKRVTLHATAMGKPLYQKLGFVEENQFLILKF